MARHGQQLFGSLVDVSDGNQVLMRRSPSERPRDAVCALRVVRRHRDEREPYQVEWIKPCPRTTSLRMPQRSLVRHQYELRAGVNNPSYDSAERVRDSISSELGLKTHGNSIAMAYRERRRLVAGSAR
jgi:hypothetical protein